jgi:hypothetical protein
MPPKCLPSGTLCDQKIRKKKAQKVIKQKKAKINIYNKAKNICNKPLLKPQNTYNKPYIETAYLG